MSYRGDRGRGFDRGRGGGMRGGPDRGRGGPGGGRGGPDNRGGYGGGGGGRGGFQDRGGRGFDRGGGRGRGGGFAPREQGGVFAPNQPAVVDARLTDNSQEALVASFRSINLHDNDLPLRPDFGTVGTPVKLRTNFFPVKVPKGPLFEYDISISPVTGTAMRRVRRRIFYLAEQTPGWAQAGLRGVVAHDHSSKLIAARKLAQPLTIVVPFYEEEAEGPGEGGKEYTLTIKFSQDIETQSLLNHLVGQPQYRGYDPLPVIAALNIILSAHPSRASNDGGVMVGRNKFFFPSPSAPPVPLGGGLEAWKGFYSSVRVAHKQLMVNVNVCTTAFYTPGNLAEAMIAFLNASHGARITAFVKGVRVRAIHLGYKKTVKTVAKATPGQHRFDCAELGGTVTVEEYFRRKYNITLQYRDLPLVDVGGQKTNYLPPELCEILPKQAFRGKLTDDHTAAMITVACKPPNVNAGAIVGLGLDELGFRQQAGPLREFGISIGTEMAIVPGRILPAPNIKYRQGTPRVDERASWNLRDVKFESGGRLDKWAVLLIQDGNNRDEFRDINDSELKQVVQGFSSMCRKSGILVDASEPAYVAARLPPKNPNEDLTRQKAISVINNTLRSIKSKPSMVLVILSNGDKHVYSGIKHLCDSYLGVATVCVHAAKIRKEKGQLQYFANVALKVNMKMGGINHALDQKSMSWLQKVPTMLVGMDVTHPGPGSVKGTPSIAAVVASVDNHYAQYPASMEIQESKKEMITNLAGMMFERLNLFKTRNKRLPDRILVYRDGVSEGQFAIVVAEELPAIRAAFRKFDAQRPYQPKLTIVICGKRHHTRFFPTEASAADRDGNPRPGTVVDRGVTAVYEFDFFLQAHGGLQGTTKPTHYYVVHDEIGFKADELQGLTNAVSYMFARATKAVSLVSPAYYADLACERGRCYLHKLLQGVSSSGTTAASSGSEEGVMQEATKMWNRGVSPTLSTTMFYL